MPAAGRRPDSTRATRPPPIEPVEHGVCSGFALKRQDPLHVLGADDQVRCYTYGSDIARGIAQTLTHPAALNEDFNRSTPVATTVRELAALIWRKIHGDALPLRPVSYPPLVGAGFAPSPPS